MSLPETRRDDNRAAAEPRQKPAAHGLPRRARLTFPRGFSEGNMQKPTRSGGRR